MKHSILALSLALCVTLSTPLLAAGNKTLAERHGDVWPEASGWAKKDTCLGCHGSYEALAKKTAKLEPNPHRSHLGAVNCQDCHKGDRAEPQLMCNDCHNFTLRQKP